MFDLFIILVFLFNFNIFAIQIVYLLNLLTKEKGKHSLSHTKSRSYKMAETGSTQVECEYFKILT